MNGAFLAVFIALSGLASDSQPATTIFSPYIGVGYGRGSQFATETMIYSYENLHFSGFNADLGGRFALTSGRLSAYAQADLINPEQLFHHENMVAFMVTQMTGWKVDILNLEAGFRYARTFDREERWSNGPTHEVFGGFVGARQRIGRFDYGLTLGLIHRTGLLTDETELPSWVDVSYHIGVVTPIIGLGWTTRRIWAFERELWGPTEFPLYISAGICFIPSGEASDFPARMLMPRDVFYYQD